MDPSANLPMIMFRVLKESREQFMSKLEKYCLMPSQVGTLFILSHKKELTQNEIAKLVNVKPSSMCVAIKKLEGMEFIVKEFDDKDQRKAKIKITEKGEGIIKELKEVSNQMESVWFKGMSDEEISTLKANFLKIYINLEENRKDY